MCLVTVCVSARNGEVFVARCGGWCVILCVYAQLEHEVS